MAYRVIELIMDKVTDLILGILDRVAKAFDCDIENKKGGEK